MAFDGSGWGPLCWTSLHLITLSLCAALQLDALIDWWVGVINLDVVTTCSIYSMNSRYAAGLEIKWWTQFIKTHSLTRDLVKIYYILRPTNLMHDSTSKPLTPCNQDLDSYELFAGSSVLTGEFRLDLRFTERSYNDWGNKLHTSFKIYYP